MLLRLREKRGQSTLEYALLLAVIVAGLIAMQVYLKRGYQGRLRQSTDDIGEQYSPGYTTGTTTTNSSSTTRDTIANKVTRQDVFQQNQDSTATETVADQSQEYWR